MSIPVRKLDDSEALQPQSPGEKTYYIHRSGEPRFKDSVGAITSALTADGSPLSLDDQVADPAAVEDNVQLYAKDVGGTSEAFLLDAAGNPIQLTSGGALALAGAALTTLPANATVYDINVNYTASDPAQVETTTIQIPNIAAQFTSLFFRYSVFVSNAAVPINGWVQFSFYWQGGAPAFPVDAFSLASNTVSGGLVNPIVGGIDIDASGFIQITILTAPFSLHGHLLVAGSSVALPFVVTP